MERNGWLKCGTSSHRIGVLSVMCACVVVAFTASGYEKAASPLTTEWGAAVTPENAWRSYPRPQMVRERWTNLNGLWDYAVTSVTNTSGTNWKI